MRIGEVGCVTPVTLSSGVRGVHLQILRDGQTCQFEDVSVAVTDSLIFPDTQRRQWGLTRGMTPFGYSPQHTAADPVPHL